MKIKEGEKLPNSKVFILSKDGPQRNIYGRNFGQDKVILFGLPGAFTPTVQQNIFQVLLIYG